MFRQYSYLDESVYYILIINIILALVYPHHSSRKRALPQRGRTASHLDWT
jgi:hypothetical protein